MGKNKSEEQIVNEARESFDLGDFLRGGKRRTKEVFVYTDEETGDELGGFETYEVSNDFGFKEKKIRTWGVAGEIITLEAEPDGKEVHAERLAELHAKAKELSAQLRESGLEISLRSIPKEIVKGARRAARKEVGITSKSATPEQEEDFDAEYNAQILHRLTTSIKRLSDGSTNDGVSLEGARLLDGQLPPSQFGKLLEAIVELQYQNAIAESAVKDADF